jgi:gamma-glutamyltranspeptidase/glutathione hydrolase
MSVFTTRPEILGRFGVVTSTHWIASAVGMSMLERGGNAFDAAVATGFVLQVVEPHLNGPGGDMPALVYSAARGKVEVICGQGPAPPAPPSRTTAPRASTSFLATACSPRSYPAVSMAGC